MLKHKFVVLAESILVCLAGTVALSTSLGQAALANSSTFISPQRQDVQRVIDRSNEQFQRGEEAFQAGNYDQARRAYDKAVDIVHESGLDEPQLKEYYRRLVDRIYQRQMALLKNAPAAKPAPANYADSTLPQDQKDQKTQPAVAQQTPATEKSEDRGFGQQTYIPSPLDDLTKLNLTEAETKDTSNEQVQTAISAAKLDFNFKPNPLVQSYINYYQGRGRATMENGLRRSGRFIGMARRIFKEEGVPQDLVWLCQVESAWSPIARSWAAAVGLWQFIPGTGAQYGLKQDYWVDERSSFEKSTRASARYLRWLANRYAGNWELAMAAYNSGEGRVDSVIARSGYADFWEVHSMLPQETRNYVPNILATIIIAKNPQRYGFTPKPEPPLAFDYVTVNNSIDLRLVADAVEVSHDYILGLNPELKRGITPPATAYALRVPPGKGKTLQVALNRIPPDKRTSWRMLTAQANDSFELIARRTGVSESVLEQVNGGVLRPGQKVIVPANGGLRNVVFSAPAKGGSTRASKASVAPSTASSMAKIITYKAKQGDTLGNIAGRYNTLVRDIATLNRLNASAKLKAGQIIKVPVKSR
jgi:membrane-bound lytic murein transglycosylase D